MRDRFGCALPIVQEERKLSNNNVQTMNSNGTYISSNGYYGYQALPQQIKTNGQHGNVEFMEVQVCDSGIQFNNYIAPEDRLSGGPQQTNIANNFMRGYENRKRRCCYDYDAPSTDLKKRREEDTIKSTSSDKKPTQAAQEKYTEDRLYEELLKETHGCTIYHWTNNSDN